MERGVLPGGVVLADISGGIVAWSGDGGWGFLVSWMGRGLLDLTLGAIVQAGEFQKLLMEF